MTFNKSVAGADIVTMYQYMLLALLMHKLSYFHLACYSKSQTINYLMLLLPFPSLSLSLSHTHADPLLNSTSSLSLETRELTYEPGTATASLAVVLRDDHVALQQPKQLALGILLSSSQCYDLTISSTLITILDSDGDHNNITHNNIIL